MKDVCSALIYLEILQLQISIFNCPVKQSDIVQSTTITIKWYSTLISCHDNNSVYMIIFLFCRENEASVERRVIRVKLE